MRGVGTKSGSAYNVDMKVSRRQLVQVLSAAAAAVPLASPAAAQAPPNAAPPAADAELESARQYLRVGAQVVRQVKLMNEVRPMIKSIRGDGEITQKGMGSTWWEKSVVFMSRVRAKASEVAKGWRKLLDLKRSRDETKGPERDM